MLLSNNFSAVTSYCPSWATNYLFLIHSAHGNALSSLENIAGLKTSINPAVSALNLGSYLGETATAQIANSFVLKKTASHSLFFFNQEVNARLNVNAVSYGSVVLQVVSLLAAGTLLFVFLTSLLFSLSTQLYAPDVFALGLDASYGLVEAEKEITNLDDVLLPLGIVLLATISWFFLIFPVQVFYEYEVALDFLTVLFFCYVILSLPINLLYECGFFFSTFFRGAAGSTSTMMELVYDLIANTTMFARMQVQHVRIILGLAMYVETVTYLETLSIGSFFSPTATWGNNSGSVSFESLSRSGLGFVIDQLLVVAITIAEIGHYLVFLIQSAASYAALIFWLFSLLYSGFIKDTLEIYFAFKNEIEKK